MPRGYYAGVIYFVLFGALIFWALRHDLELNRAANQQQSNVPPIHVQGDKGYSGASSAAGQQGSSSDTSAIVPGIPASALSDTRQPQPDSGHKETKEGWWDRFRTDPVATFTAALALFTLVLAGVAVWQGVHLQRSVDAARTSADALQALERGYVAVGFGEFAISVSMGWGIVIGIANDGRTKATVKDILVKFNFDKTLPDIPLYGHEDDNLRTLDSILAAHSNRWNIDTFYFGNAPKAFCYGFVRYSDVFKKKWTYRFCVMINTEAGGIDRCSSAGPSAYHEETEGWDDVQPTEAGAHGASLLTQ